MKLSNVLVLATLAGVACVSAQAAYAPKLVLKRLPFNPSLSEYTSNNTSPFWIGNNPSAVTIYGQRVYVAGANTTGANGPIGMTIIENVYDQNDGRYVAPAPSYARFDTDVPAADKPSWPQQRFYVGMNFSPETSNPSSNSLTVANLVLGADGGGTVAAGLMTFAIADSSVSLAPVGSIAAGVVRTTTVAFDRGALGTGFADIDPGLAGATGVAVMPFSSSGPRSYSTDGTLSPVYFNGEVIMRAGGSTSGSLYRVLDIDRDLFVARAGAAIYISKRDTSSAAPSNAWTVQSTIALDGGTTPGDTQAFTNFHNAAILRGAPGGPNRVFIYNDQFNGTAANFSSVIRFRDETGALIDVPVLDLDGVTPFAIPANGRINPSEVTAAGTAYAMGWDSVNKRLALTNFSNRALLVFGATTDCPFDLNSDGLVDNTDFVEFANQYNNFFAPGGPLTGADSNADGVVDNTDFVAFASSYNDFLCPGNE